MRELPTGTVTFLFTDIEGSTRLIQRLRDRWADVQADHHRLLRAAFSASGGQEVDSQGEALFYVFLRARDAVAAAAAGQVALASHTWPAGGDVRVRVGIHTGEPAAGEEGYLGLDVARAARICAAAHGGQVLLSETTRALIAGDQPEGMDVIDLGEQRLKDLQQPERIYQLLVPGLLATFPRVRTVAGGKAGAPQELAGRVDALAAQAQLAARRLQTPAQGEGAEHELLGRTAECAQIERLLADARVGTSGVLVVAGEPGIGKSALLRHAAEHAEGMSVLSARAVQSEAEVPFAGLLELLRPALQQLERIPPPQAAALAGSLALGPARESGRFVVGAATLSLLTTHAENEPTLVLVDDAQWLDGSSTAALVFAARRLVADSIAILIAHRAGEAPALEESGLPRLTLGGLDAEAARALLARHAGVAVPSDIADRLVRATAANPLALVELAGDALKLGADLLEGPVPISMRLEEAFLRRADALSEPARHMLVLAAAEESGQLTTLARAADSLSLEVVALEEAERAGLIAVTDAVLDFRHPLVRSAVYNAAHPAERRAAHRAVAESLSPDHDADRRAWHLAAATFGPDEAVAEALSEAAQRALGRSGYAAAATAFERAARFTVDEERHAERLFGAAEAAWLAGQADRTVSLLEEARGRRADPRLHAAIEHLRGHAETYRGLVMTGHDILVQAAARIAASHPDEAIVMYAEAVWASLYAGLPETMLETASSAWELLTPEAGERQRFRAGLALGMALIWNGQGAEGARLIRQAVSVLDRSDALGQEPLLLASAAEGPLWLREAETGRALIARAMETARAQGALGALPFALTLGGRDAATSERWAVAETLYDEAIRLARETGQATTLAGSLAGLACVEARRGREADCRTHAAEALELSDRHGLGLFRLWALDALADLELGLGHVDNAIERLEEKDRKLGELGVADPDVSPVPELVEAYTRQGRRFEPASAFELYSRSAEEKGQPWALARTERARALLADPDGFEHHFDEALRLHQLTPDLFEQARTRLCYGERLRRAKRRVRARDELRGALEIFDELGAEPWAERARVELLATGETARRRDASTLDQLTPQELRIALTLAQGKTTREAAAQLYLSPKTIEYHLRNVYRKLGVRTHEALAAALADLEQTPDPSPTTGAHV